MSVKLICHTLKTSAILHQKMQNKHKNLATIAHLEEHLVEAQEGIVRVDLVASLWRPDTAHDLAHASSTVERRAHNQ